MKKYEIIDALVAQGVQKKTLKPFFNRFMSYMPLILLLNLLIFISIAPLRSRFLTDFFIPLFSLESATLFFLSLMGSYLAFKLSVPGNSAKAILKVLVSAGLLYFMFHTLSHVHTPLEETMGAKRAYCYLEVILYSFAVFFLMMKTLNQAAPTRKRLSALIVSISAAAFNIGLMQIGCVIEPSHILKFHILPALLMILLGTAIGPKLLNWDTKN